MRRGRPKRLPDGTISPTLRQLGISKKLSSESQRLARIPEAEFERRLAAAMSEGKAPTARGLLRDSPRRPEPSDVCPYCGGTGKRRA